MITAGSLHPVTLYLRQAITCFRRMGFTVLDSPEIVAERNNFDDLLIPRDHPARSMHDTFWLIDGRLPRTHTSAYQIPAMQGRRPPVRFVIPGRAFRNESTDATHEIQFLNFEGLAIDRNVSLAHLKGTLLRLMREVYGADADVRFVPSYFPFVEPGLEIYAKIRDRWVELGGAGMIHPGVLTNMGVDPGQYQGFAFGMGLDRLTMMQYGVEDVRHFYSGNLRFLGQFRLTPEPVVDQPRPRQGSTKRRREPPKDDETFWEDLR